MVWEDGGSDPASYPMGSRIGIQAQFTSWHLDARLLTHGSDKARPSLNRSAMMGLLPTVSLSKASQCNANSMWQGSLQVISVVGIGWEFCRSERHALSRRLQAGSNLQIRQSHVGRWLTTLSL